MLWLYVHFPQLQLDALLESSLQAKSSGSDHKSGAYAERALIVFDAQQNRVLQCNAVARAASIVVGMGLGTAASLCPNLEVIDYRYEAEEVMECLRNEKLESSLMSLDFSLDLIELLDTIRMKAGIYYPSWPDMNGEFVPSLLWKSQFWTVESFNYYDQYPLVPALIQSIHRIVAYILFFSGLYLFFKQKSINQLGHEIKANYLFISLLTTQVILGILTVINCVGEVPLFYGVMHQAFAMLLLMVVLYYNYLLSKE